MNDKNQRDDMALHSPFTTHNSLVPRLRFPEFRGAGEWPERQLGDFLRESRVPGSKGDVAKKITVKLWGNGVFEKKEAVQGSANTQYYRRQAGQFIYSKLDFLNQAFGVIPPHLDSFESTVDLPCFDIDEQLNPKFLLEYVKRKDFYERLGETADGSRKARRIHAETFLSFCIALPASDEQQKIAACLSSLDTLIAAQADKLDALKTHKKGLMQQLFPREGETVPRLRFPEFREAGEWCHRTLDAFVSERNQLPEAKLPLYSLSIEDGVAPKTERYERSFLVKNEAEAYKIVQPNDFAYNPMNLRFGAIGRHSGSEPVAVSKYYNIFYCDSSVDSRFCEIYFRSPRMIAYYNDVAIGSLIEKRRVHFSDFLGFQLRFPALEEQQKIAACLSSLDTLIATQAEKLDALKTHKKGLMQQLFPGPEAVAA
ncbi:MAG: restriction endonuclease subunit S [Thiohalocapsa sp. PB-PSB1]|jgi:type I restriction enzyme S subunit|nr:MAG: restriction endonuclease subunit S [Thiohalocapsa sp. PB-PSB1]HCS88929.1 hypothetical protein [Chromatiaceae bacterium]